MTAAELTKWIVDHGYSQARLARALGVNRSAVSRWESGITPLPPFLPLALRTLERQMLDDLGPDPLGEWHGRNV